MGILKPTGNNQIKICTTTPEKTTIHSIGQIIEYEHDAIVSKSIMKKIAGSVSVMAFDEGKGLDEKNSPFDTFVQIIDGVAEIIIDGRANMLNAGDGIIIPAHSSSFIKPNGRFKMLATIIKSGYE